MARSMGDRIEKYLVKPFLDIAARMLEFDRGMKRLIVFAIDILSCILSVWIAFSLRLGRWDLMSSGTRMVIAAALVLWFAIAFPSGVYRAIFRVVGSRTIVNLAVAAASMAVPMVVIFMLFSVPGVPRTIAVLQPMIFFLLLVLSRIVARYLMVDLIKQRNFAGRQRRTLIYGAGSAGQQLALSIQAEPGMTLVGFVDDDRRMHGHRLDRMTITHSRFLRDLIDKHDITDVLVALPSASRSRRKRVVSGLQKFNVHVQILPGMLEIVDGQVSISDLREVEIEDLLGRDPVAPYPELLDRTITGKVVMITGAGGSIGSELCRQIARLRPARLVLVESYEFGLYAIDRELMEIARETNNEQMPIAPELVNVADADAIARVMERWRPDTVFHAAAYKHVPLVEANVVSGARNNIFGTFHTASAADRVGVQHFILISTDKAVRPTNVMGATKRVCELVLQALAARGSGTTFAMVRFGNVLGSSGSVVPLFQRQIRNGGPVTVTDKRVTRFFMTIPEASQLVIQAGGMAKGGEVYVLDMGKPMKIVDFARSMIHLSGMTVRDEENPDGDIEIAEIGLRPGEKLYEELLIGNDPRPTAHERIMQAHESFLPFDELRLALDRLDRSLSRGARREVLSLLMELVPEFHCSADKASADQSPEIVVPSGLDEAAAQAAE